MTEDPLIALQTQVAFQEHQLQQFGEQLSAQQQQLYHLEQLCRQLASRLSQVVGAGAMAPQGMGDEQEKPPHY
ncbi:SlyX family protein [Desulfuromonas thiophila]|jgi:SlyX protein|uniref:SlyX family protein n=1 Tax=Desulfuromonas thiophila TaxID=57664 RepID=UPI0024A991A2|nr:SlyX family protein [Desulfuromonas thiophila]